MKKSNYFVFLILSVLGILDSGYLTYEHYLKVIPPCTVNRLFPFLSDCGKVLQSQYALILNTPVALIGLIYYSILFFVILFGIIFHNKILRIWILIQSTGGMIASLYFMYLQIFVIGSICIYCTTSAIISFIFFILTFLWLSNERKFLVVYIGSFKYQCLLKPIFFLINPETVHELMINFGEFLGKSKILKSLIHLFVPTTFHTLKQTLTGIEFDNPVGLAAGFDYNASLTQILSSIGFGFQSIGTITNMPYKGNPKPMLGRLPKSKSLMVNKGFKNYGANKVIEKLNHLHFSIPVGISIGRTNSPKLKTQKQSVDDVVKAFILFEKSIVKNAYYELNISCPNLIHGKNLSFYPPKNLRELLEALKKLNIRKPVFAKMPIEKSDNETLDMLRVLNEFSFVKGVILGNLQKDRNAPSLNQEEVKMWKVGNFSGKPCEQRSNELIKLAYQNSGKRFVIIGCGGIFSAKDAYKKIRLGANLVQLVTGMIYQGPMLIAQINLELMEMLKKDGYKNINEAVGVDVK